MITIVCIHPKQVLNLRMHSLLILYKSILYSQIQCLQIFISVCIYIYIIYIGYLWSCSCTNFCKNWINKGFTFNFHSYTLCNQFSHLHVHREGRPSSKFFSTSMIPVSLVQTREDDGKKGFSMLGDRRDRWVASCLRSPRQVLPPQQWNRSGRTSNHAHNTA